MKKIIVVLLSVIFVLVTGSVHYISADDSTDNLSNADTDNSALPSLRTAEDSEYQLHVQVIVRNAQGELAAVTEGTYGAYVLHKITDNVFDEVLPKKEIVTVNNIKYEKAQFGDTFRGGDFVDQNGVWLVTVCGDVPSVLIGARCAFIFEARTNQVVLEDDDVVYTNWTILRAMD